MSHSAQATQTMAAPVPKLELSYLGADSPCPGPGTRSAEDVQPLTAHEVDRVRQEVRERRLDRSSPPVPGLSARFSNAPELELQPPLLTPRKDQSILCQASPPWEGSINSLSIITTDSRWPTCLHREPCTLHVLYTSHPLVCWTLLFCPLRRTHAFSLFCTIDCAARGEAQIARCGHQPTEPLPQLHLYNRKLLSTHDQQTNATGRCEHTHLCRALI